ncbi:PaaI family thioesterase [Streptomyces profundus]|uniref:PaaI family thioesterase n=1 Tax=Streptomyces profundus TaxID=2867410 RepID=UPI001D15EABC|nr:PaaI family thioesterase [Streptomyces sp. MA3_2.13]UED87614.1 PaaI family thioesterase [Streptomyces sp. MA3_2.13]
MTSTGGRAARTKTISYHAPEPDREKLFALSGLEQLRQIQAGLLPDPPISSLFGLRIVNVDEGDVVFTAEPDESHYNPIGSVHGGFFATVLDTACGCAFHTTLPPEVGYTTLEIKVSFLRPITADTGMVTAHGWVIRRGRGAGFTDADIRDRDGRVLATASSTLLVTQPRPIR